MPQIARETATPRPLAPTKNHHSQRTSDTTSSRTNDSTQHLQDIGEAPKKSGFFGAWLPTIFGSPSTDRQGVHDVEEDIEVPSENDVTDPFADVEEDDDSVASEIEDNTCGQGCKASTDTFALGWRSVQGVIATSLFTFLVFHTLREATPSKDKAMRYVANADEVLKDVANYDALELYPQYATSMRKEGDERFAELLTAKQEEEACVADLMAQHNQYNLDWQANYEGLVNKTQDIIAEQEKVIEEAQEEWDEQGAETLEDLDQTLFDIQKTRDELKAAKTAAVAKYKIEYDKSVRNIEAGQEFKDDVNSQVANALGELKDTHDKIDRHSSRGPARKAILKKAKGALDKAEKTLTSIGDTELNFEELGTPEEYEAKLNEEFKEMDEMLNELEKTTKRIKTQVVANQLTQDELVAALAATPQELNAYIESQTPQANMVKSSASFLQLYEAKRTAAQNYMNATRSNQTDPNATLAEIEKNKDQALKEITDLFNSTLLSDKAEDKFDTWETVYNVATKIILAIAGAALLYPIGSTVVRSVNECRNKPGGNWLPRFRFTDFQVKKFATAEAGKKTDQRVKDMMCEAKGSSVITLLKVLAKNPMTTLLISLWAVNKIRNSTFRPIYEELDRTRTERKNVLNATLTDKQIADTEAMQAYCVDEYDKSLSAHGLDAATHEYLQELAKTNPGILEAENYLLDHQTEACQNQMKKVLESETMTDEEKLEHCKKITEEYAGEYYDQNFDTIEEYNEQVDEIMESLKGEEREYIAEESLLDWLIIAHGITSLISVAYISSRQYGNPEEPKKRNMHSRAMRGWGFKKAQRGLAKAYAHANHVFSHFGVGIGPDKKPLIEMTTNWNHMKGWKAEKPGTAHLASTTGKKAEGSASKTDKKRIKEVRDLMSEDTKGMSDQEIEYIMDNNIAIFSRLGKTKEPGLLDRAKAVIFSYNQKTEVEALEEVEMAYRDPKESITYDRYPNNV